MVDGRGPRGHRGAVAGSRPQRDRRPWGLVQDVVVTRCSSGGAEQRVGPAPLGPAWTAVTTRCGKHDRSRPVRKCSHAHRKSTLTFQKVQRPCPSEHLDNAEGTADKILLNLQLSEKEECYSGGRASRTAHRSDEENASTSSLGDLSTLTNEVQRLSAPSLHGSVVSGYPVLPEPRSVRAGWPEGHATPCRKLPGNRDQGALEHSATSRVL